MLGVQLLSRGEPRPMRPLHQGKQRALACPKEAKSLGIVFGSEKSPTRSDQAGRAAPFAVSYEHNPLSSQA